MIYSVMILMQSFPKAGPGISEGVAVEGRGSAMKHPVAIGVDSIT
jgi:hypothetical protein